MRSDKTARKYLAAVQLAVYLVWLKASFCNTPQRDPEDAPCPRRLGIPSATPGAISADRCGLCEAERSGPVSGLSARHSGAGERHGRAFPPVPDAGD
jgi:hypothetical protein